MISVSNMVLPLPHLSLYRGKGTGFDCFGVFPNPSLFPKIKITCLILSKHPLRFERTPTGHRRFDLADIKKITPRGVRPLEERITINYARVSSHDQKDNLTRQVQVLEAFSSANGWQFERIQDVGSGLNYNKKGLHELLKRIIKRDVGLMGI